MPEVSPQLYELAFPEEMPARGALLNVLHLASGNELELHEAKQVIIGHFRLTGRTILQMQQLGIQVTNLTQLDHE